MVSRCRISTSLLARLTAEARAASDREICGILLGHGGEIEGRAAIPNVARDPFRAFEFDPGAYIAASRTARAEGQTIIGVYHSHKSHDASPSRQDARNAGDPGRYWLILAGGDARLWISRPGGAVLGVFDPVELYVD